MKPKFLVPTLHCWNTLILIAFTMFFLTACETTPNQKSLENAQQPERGLARIEPLPVTEMPQLALVIGNNDYEYRRLANTVNDAADMAEQLKQMGFDVTLETNLNQEAMERVISQFTARLAKTPGVGLFYFSGHGTQVDGHNYLLPIDNKKIVDRYGLKAYAVNVGNNILARMDAAKNHLNVIILDACRDDPYPSIYKSANAKRGLARMQSTTGTIIAFATAPGDVASDVSIDEDNGLYTKYLLTGLQQAHQKHQRIDDMLMQVRNSVIQESSGAQEPWYNASLSAPYCFGGCQASSLIANKPEKKELKLTAESGKKFDPLKLLHQKAEKGDVYAQSQLGRMYEYGRNVRKNYNEAIKWYRLAAKQGNADAQDGLGHMYWTGTGVQKDYQKALKWFRLSAEQGYSRGQKNLGWMYLRGDGVPQDYEEALKWYRLAAKQENSNAQSLIGDVYKFGQGVPKDYKEAAKWYRLSAENQSHKTPYGAYALGGLYEIGKGVPQDDNEAIKWYRIAAQRGSTHALDALSRLGEK